MTTLELMREAARDIGRAHKALNEGNGEKAAAWLNLAEIKASLAKSVIEMSLETRSNGRPH